MLQTQPWINFDDIKLEKHTLIPAPRATWQSEVNSKTINKVDIGPPITQDVTAAIPAITNNEQFKSGII